MAMTSAESILKDLVSFPVLGGESNLTIIDYIEKYLWKYNIESVRVPNHDKSKASLHCRVGPSVSGGIILSGHTDVVPVQGQDWDTDPFQLTEKGDKLYGRGSCDMKGFLACCLAAVPEMSKRDLKKPIYFAFSYDEEIGCLGSPDLIKAISNYYKEKPSYAIIGEPSMLEPIVGQKGICVFETAVNGSAGHSSRIKQEVSAIHEAAKLIVWLENKMDDLINNGQLDERFIPPHTSIHSGKIRGGIAPNVIADECIFSWDVRNIPGDKIIDVKESFDEHCSTRMKVLRKIFPEFEIKTVNHHPIVPALNTHESEDIVKLLIQLSGKNKLKTVSYAAEAGQFEEGGFPSVICGPGDIAQAHRANEFISKDQLEKGVIFIKKIVNYFS